MVTPPIIGVLAYQGDVPEHLRSLERCGAQAVEVRTPAELAAVSGLVLPGGESTVIGKLAHRFDMLEPLRRRILGGLPILGTCAGLIFLAREVEGPPQHLLGVLDVRVRRNAFGRQKDSFEAEVALEGVAGGAVRGVFIRAPWVERVGDGVSVLAALDGRIVAVAQGAVMAAAFHPELVGDDRLHEALVSRAAGVHSGSS